MKSSVAKTVTEKTQQTRRDANKQKPKDNQPSGSEENALLWDMMGVYHSTANAYNTTSALSFNTRAGASVNVPNMIFDGTKGWQERSPDSHPMLNMMVKTDAADYSRINRVDPKLGPTKAKGVCDSGAQSCLLGICLLHAWGIKPKYMLPVSQGMNTISGEGIKIIGAVFLRLVGTDPNGQKVEAPVMAYVTNSTKRFYLSLHAMRQLGVVGDDFPTVHAPKKHEIAGITAECGCQRHTNPPALPKSLPFSATPVNIDSMREWILQR